MAIIPVVVSTTTAGDVLRSSEKNIQSCHARSHWLDSLLTCFLWYDRFCRTVSVVLYAGLWHAEMWTYRWFAETLTAYVLSRWQETRGSLQLSSGGCSALPPAPQNCNLIQTRTFEKWTISLFRSQSGSWPAWPAVLISWWPHRTIFLCWADRRT